MIDLFDLYNRFCSENNTYQGGLFRPERDFERAANNISLELWNDWTAQAEKSQEITDELSVFLKSVNVIVEATTQNYGLIKYKENYGKFSSARILLHNNGETVPDSTLETCNEIGGDCATTNHIETDIEAEERTEKYKDGITEQVVTLVSNSKWASLLNHRSKKPTFGNPAMTQYDGGFKVAPRQASVVVFDYYIRPTAATFKYTLAAGDPQTGAGDYIIYNSLLSKKLQWRETMIPEFLDRLSKVYSKYTRDSLLFQMNKAS